MIGPVPLTDAAKCSERSQERAGIAKRKRLPTLRAF